MELGLDFFLGVYIIIILNALVGSGKIRNVIPFFFLILFTFLCMYRSENVGIDTPSYLSKFHDFKYDNEFNYEFLFYYINHHIANLGFNVQSNQMIMALLTYLPLLYIFLRKSSDSAITLVVFITAIIGYFFESFSMQRQCIATSFLLMGYTFTYERKYIYAIICAFIAQGFHSTSIVFILLAIYAYIAPSWDEKKIKIALILSFLWAISIGSIDIFSPIFNNLDFLGFSKFSMYSDYHLEETRNLNGLLPLLLPNTIFCYFTYETYKDSYYMKIMVLGVLLLNIFCIFPISYRMAYGLMIIEVLTYPMVIKYAIDDDGLKCSLVAKGCLFVVASWCILYNWVINPVALVNKCFVPYTTF